MCLSSRHQCRGHALHALRHSSPCTLSPSTGTASSASSRWSCLHPVTRVHSILEIKDGSCQISQQNCSLKSSERCSIVNKTMTNGMDVGEKKIERRMPRHCVPAAFPGRLLPQTKPGRRFIKDPPALPPAHPPPGSVRDTLLSDMTATGACSVHAHVHMKIISQWQYSMRPDADQQILL